MVKQIKKILVPFDGSTNSIRALTHAISIAKPSNATITGLYVLKTPMPKDTAKVLKKWINKARQDAFDILDRARTRVEYEGIKFDQKIATGNPGQVITDFAHKNDFDMIVIGARGLSKIKSIFLGSVSNYVVHMSKIPVVVVH